MPEKVRMPEVIPTSQSGHVPAVACYTPMVSPHQEVEVEAPSVPLSHYLWILRQHLWKILAFTASCILVTAIYTARIQPVFEATTTVNVDFQVPAGVVGQDSTTAYISDPDTFLATQIKLIQTDAVLRPVAEEFHLLAQSSKSSPPNSIGAPIAPIALGPLEITRPVGTNLLLISYRSTDPRLAADVANAVASSFLTHTYNIRIRSSASLSSFMAKQLEELRAKMEKSNLALAQFEKDLDVIDPSEDKSNILSSRLMQLNQEYTNAQIDRVNKQAALESIKSGSVEAAQVSSQGGSLDKLSSDLEAARQHLALVKTTFGPNHPEYRKAANQLSELQNLFNEQRDNVIRRIDALYSQAVAREQSLENHVNATKAEWDSLNSRSFHYRQLKQEADADKALYDELVKKIQEADINAGFQDNNISIADPARPPMRPVYPNLRTNLLMALIVSLLLGVGTAILLDSIDTTLRDPQEAGRFLGVDVIGTLPLDRSAAQLPKPVVHAQTSTALARVPNSDRNGHYESASSFEEAVRTIRNTILLSDFEGRLRSIAITSAAPSEGKTTTAAHLAISNADRGRKTLLVDGDLRRPSLNSKFGLTPRAGLSNVLTGEMLWQDVVLRVEDTPNLTLLPAGPGSHRAADLFGPRLAPLLDEFAKDYDLVIMDAPPLLGFAECLQIANTVDGVLIVSLAGETKRKAVASVVSVLQRIRANIIGVVMNQVSHSTSSAGYYYGYYHYGHYGSKSSERSE
jgi:capsular exopolysaccharide synthesis family protein